MGISGWKRTCCVCLMLLIMLEPVKDQLISAASKINVYNECNSPSATGSALIECSGEEFETMESDQKIERVRSVRAAGKYISPGVLKSNRPFCRSVGQPYQKSCIPKPSNPYNRGCSNIYMCRHNLH